MVNLSKRSFTKNLVAFFATILTFDISKAIADWPRDLFSTRNTEKLINEIAHNQDISNSDLIDIKAPEIAENGAVVPVTVSTQLPDVKTISILVDNNPSPLISSFEINQQLSPYVSTRVKMAKTSNITAIVASKDGYFSASRTIKVTIGGCGG